MDRGSGRAAAAVAEGVGEAVRAGVIGVGRIGNALAIPRDRHRPVGGRATLCTLSGSPSGSEALARTAIVTAVFLSVLAQASADTGG